VKSVMVVATPSVDRATLSKARKVCMREGCSWRQVLHNVLRCTRCDATKTLACGCAIHRMNWEEYRAFQREKLLGELIEG